MADLKWHEAVWAGKMVERNLGRVGYDVTKLHSHDRALLWVYENMLIDGSGSAWSSPWDFVEILRRLIVEQRQAGPVAEQPLDLNPGYLATGDVSDLLERHYQSKLAPHETVDSNGNKVTANCIGDQCLVCDRGEEDGS